MSELKSYKHTITGKVGTYREDFAALFPALKLVAPSLARIAAPVDVVVEPVVAAPAPESKPAFKNKREVAE
jgi:hypothetical protein